ncbi:MAG: M1 family peptidase [Calditrichaeota bacterium]|nr:MAG: M1 family peptidase [Calditrichota bacterium]
MSTKFCLSLIVISLIFSTASAQENNLNKNKFRQLKQELATPNVYRTASGAPGHQYYQQKADYQIAIELDDENQRIYGEETITYFNNSPDPLTYLWLQLDQNIRSKDSDALKIRTSEITEKMSTWRMKALEFDFDGGFKIEFVRDKNNRDLPFTVNNTMMRVDLPTPLLPNQNFNLKLKWWYNINDRAKVRGRSGMEYFKENDNYLYIIAQFYPRMAVYNEVEGWQNKQFLGSGEFTLPFGDYNVAITAPVDHVVSATGELQNGNTVLNATQRQRLKKSIDSATPVFIVTEQEARDAEKGHATKKKTWQFAAKNVRDFAFASSRKFIWDAMGVKFGNRTVMAMSFYPKEGNPLWEKYSTRVVAHTLKTYSKFTFPYPYPVAQSIHSKFIGMEYPMICFNGGRPEPDGTYSARTKFGMLSVIIHEVGHNFFPMIVNSDERQWTWMDEGLNSFLQYLTEQEWQRDYPSRRGPIHKIVDYMKTEKTKLTPIMTNSESLFDFSMNAYGKPAAALNVLRETIMGRELFDFAFKEYSERWMFRHPTPADFFRTMEDASAIDLDWFWRGWFYSTDHVDIALANVRWFNLDTQNPEVEKPITRLQEQNREKGISVRRNKTLIAQTITEQDTSMLDFYDTYDKFEVNSMDQRQYNRMLTSLDSLEKELLGSKKNYYELTFENKGGLVMPLILKFDFTDGSHEMQHIPAEIWKLNHDKVTKVFVFEKEVRQIVLDPFLATADVETSNNYWPPQNIPSRFQLYKMKRRSGKNPMQLEKEMQTEK